MKVTLEIPDGVAETLPDNLARNPRALLVELACALYATHKMTHAQACKLASLDRLDFQQELGLREIPIHYTREDLAHDIAFARGQ